MAAVERRSKAFTGKIGTDGSVTVPMEVRQVLKIRRGDIVDVVVYEPEKVR